jgi:hypothetical protein
LPVNRSDKPSIFDRTNPEGIYPGLGRFETRLGLPLGFCDGLLHEDDWSFVIKLHALLEAALTALLAEHVGDGMLEGVFSRLAMNDKETGKVAFAEALDLLNADERRFLRGLSEMRNDLVHQIRNVSFTIRSHVDTLNPQQRKAFVKRFALGAEDRDGPGFQSDYAIQNPRLFIWQGGLLVVAIAMLRIETLKSERRLQEAYLNLWQGTVAEPAEAASAYTELQSLLLKAQSTGDVPGS